MSIVGKSSQRYSGFDPRTLGDCALWLDGADRNSLSLSGSNVTQWRDKSGNGRNATATGNPTINGRGGINFTGSNYFTGSISNGTTTVSGFLVGDFSSSSGQYSRIVSLGTTGQYDYDNASRICLFIRNISNEGIQSYRVTDLTTVSITYNTTFVASVVFNGTNSTMYRNGTAGTTVASTGTFGYSLYGVGVDPGGLIGSSLYGTIYEVLIFNTALSTSDRQQVEGYLAWKWGISSSFQPTAVPGLSLWLDAADSTTLTLSGSNVTQWRDKSVNAMTATPSNGNVWMSNQNGYTGVYVNNNNSVLAPGTTRLTLSSNFMTFSNYTLLGVVEFTTLGTNQTVFSDQRASSGESRTQLGITQSFETDSVGNLRVLSLTDISNRQILGWTSLPSAFTAFRNGSALASNTTTFSTYGTDAGALPSLGAPSGTSDNRFMTGWFYEVIMYSSNLSTDQRQQVEDYLSRKWNVSLSRTILNLPSSHPFRLAPPVLRPFNPTDIANCALWLDAADSRTLTLSGSNVTVWADKSGNANNAVTSSRFPALGPTVTTSNSLLFTRVPSTSTQFLRTQTGRQTTSAVTFAMVVRYGGDNDGGSFFDMRKASDGNVLLAILGNKLFARGSTSALLNVSNAFPTTFAVTVIQATTNTYASFINGTSVGSSTATLDMPSADSAWTTIGAGTDIAAMAGYSNQINESASSEFREVIMFNSFLTTAQRQQVESYLAQKWGLQGTTPSTHPARIAPALSVQFQPTLLSNCALWLDAADAKTLTLSGSNVTAWTDKSSNAYQSTVAGSPVYTRNSRLNQIGCVSFNGTSDSLLWNSFSLNQPFTAFAVCTLRISANPLYAFVLEPTTSSNAVILYTSSGPVLTMWAGLQNQTTSPTVTFSSNITGVYSAIFNGTSSLLGFNGAATSNLSPGTSNWTGLYLGRDWGGIFQPGEYGEVIFYSGALSTAQRQQVEGYLATKWGLQGSLPSTHPYKTTPLL